MLNNNKIIWVCSDCKVNLVFFIICFFLNIIISSSIYDLSFVLVNYNSVIIVFILRIDINFFIICFFICIINMIIDSKFCLFDDD